MLHVVERGCGTIKKSVGRLHGSDVVRRKNMLHRVRLHSKDDTATWEGWKVTVADTVHGKMSHVRHQGEGNM